jgi:hypothetical protein
MSGSPSENPERKDKQSGRVSLPAADLADGGIKPFPSGTHDPQAPSAGWRWTVFYRKYRIAAFLLLPGLAGFAFAWMIYPHPSDVRQLSTPGIVDVIINTKTSNDKIRYSVIRKASITSITLTAFATPKAADGKLEVRLYLPHGPHFRSCNPPSCSNERYFPIYNDTLTYTKDQAEITVQVNTSTLSGDANGEEAVAVLPNLSYKGEGQPSLGIQMTLAGANKYDWAPLPASDTNTYGASWDEQLVNGQVAARIVSGTNPTALQKTNRRTFEAGLLIGIAGGALIGGIQEALKAWLETPRQ